jgi:hypothetical protein
MHLSDGEIRAYQDQELRPDRYPQVRAHLASCAQCQMQADHLEETSRQVEQQLSLLQIDPDRVPSATGAGFKRLEAALGDKQQEEHSMSNKLTSKRYRPVWVGAALVIMLAIALTFPQVRAAANSFLGLFRVEQIAVVRFDPQALEQGNAASAQIESILSEDVKFEEMGEYQTAASAAEASNIAGFTVRLPEAIEVAQDLDIQPGGRATFAVDLPRFQAMLDAIGKSDIKLPKELQGQTVTLEMPVAVTAFLGDCKPVDVPLPEGQDPDAQVKAWQNPCSTLVQLPSPTISAPPGLDVAQIGQAYLQLLGMSESDAAQFASAVDWTTTFVIPIPRYGTEYRPITVDGVQGTFIQQGIDPQYSEYLLLWVKDGIVYGLTGGGTMEEAVEIANSLK